VPLAVDPEAAERLALAEDYGHLRYIVRPGSERTQSSVNPADLTTLTSPIQVAAGQIVYVGRLTVTGHSAIGRRGFAYTYEWDRDPAREAEALTIVADRYKKSPWIPAVQRRLTALPPRP